jgi:cysteinyl-tRNA synthetase
VLFDLASDVNRTHSASLAGQLKALGACLGLLQLQPEAFLKRGAGSAVALADDAVIDALIAERSQAKQDRDFAEADRIRAQLLEMGVVLKDGPTGTRWERAR